MENGNILVLSERQIMSVLDMPAALESVETSLREIAEGRCINPMKLHMSLRPGIQGYLNSMPSCLLAQDVMGAKLVSVYKDNAKNFGLPVTMGTIVLHHPESGLPFAVLGGTYITALRTGAAAGVGAKYLARKDSHVLLQIGAGAQVFCRGNAGKISAGAHRPLHRLPQGHPWCADHLRRHDLSPAFATRDAA